MCGLNKAETLVGYVSLNAIIIGGFLIGAGVSFGYFHGWQAEAIGIIAGGGLFLTLGTMGGIACTYRAIQLHDQKEMRRIQAQLWHTD